MHFGTCTSKTDQCVSVTDSHWKRTSKEYNRVLKMMTVPTLSKAEELRS